MKIWLDPRGKRFSNKCLKTAGNNLNDTQEMTHKQNLKKE